MNHRKILSLILSSTPFFTLQHYPIHAFRPLFILLISSKPLILSICPVIIHTSFNRLGTPSLALSIFWTPPMMAFTPFTSLSYFPQGKQLELYISINIHHLLPLRSPIYPSYIPFAQPIYTASPSYTGWESVMAPAPFKGRCWAHTLPRHFVSSNPVTFNL